MRKWSTDDNPVYASAGMGAPTEPAHAAMNLLLLVDSFLPHAGGSRVYYYHLYKNLCERFQDQVTILSKKVDGWQEFDSSMNTDRLQIVRRFRPLPNWKYYQMPKTILPLMQTLQWIRSSPTDLIHTGDLFPQGLVGLCAKKAFGIPYVTYCHGEEITQTEQFRYQPALRNTVYNSASAVIAANEFARTNLIRIGIPESKVFKITPGVDIERFAPRAANPTLLDHFQLRGKTVLLSVGRLVTRKGHAHVLRALSRMRGTIPAWHYLIVGQGPESASLGSLISQLGLSAHVTLVGKVPEGELADYYNLCDLFVLANREVAGDLEGFGMVFLEANATGKPVLGGRTGGAAEAVLDNVTGLLVNPEDIAELVHALELLISNTDLRHRLGADGLRRALTQFSWGKRAQMLREVCNSVLGHSGRPLPTGS